MDLKKLKKVELHCHLEGAVRLSTLSELAKAKKVDLPYSDPAKLRKALCVTEPLKSLSDLLERLFRMRDLLDSEELYERVTFEYIEDSFNQGVRLVELRYNPIFAAEASPSLKLEHIHRGILSGIKLAQKKYPVGVGLIGILGRVLPMNVVKQEMDFILENKDTFCGIDLADKEDGFEPKPFAPYFEKARSEGLRITVHAGEINIPGASKYVYDAITYLHAERIGHGVQISEDKKIMDLVRDNGIVLEMCPISNWLSSSVVGGHKAHPIRKYLEYGIKVTINSDDPGLFGSTLIDDYKILADYHNFTEKEFNQCNQIAFDACFIKGKEKYWN